MKHHGRLSPVNIRIHAFCVAYGAFEKVLISSLTSNILTAWRREGRTSGSKNDGRAEQIELASPRRPRRSLGPTPPLSQARRTQRVCPPGAGRKETPVPLVVRGRSLGGGYKAASLAGWMGSTGGAGGGALERWPHRRPCCNDAKLTASASFLCVKVPHRLWTTVWGLVRRWGLRGWVQIVEPRPINISCDMAYRLEVGLQQAAGAGCCWLVKIQSKKQLGHSQLASSFHFGGLYTFHCIILWIMKNDYSKIISFFLNY